MSLAAGIPFDVTVLYLGRCTDCRLFRTAAPITCDAGIGGTAIEWATAERTINPAPEAWHYCREYKSPIAARDTWIVPEAAPANLSNFSDF